MVHYMICYENPTLLLYRKQHVTDVLIQVENTTRCTCHPFSHSAVGGGLWTCLLKRRRWMNKCSLWMNECNVSPLLLMEIISAGLRSLPSYLNPLSCIILGSITNNSFLYCVNKPSELNHYAWKILLIVQLVGWLLSSLLHELFQRAIMATML